MLRAWPRRGSGAAAQDEAQLSSQTGCSTSYEYDEQIWRHVAAATNMMNRSADNLLSLSALCAFSPLLAHSAPIAGKHTATCGSRALLGNKGPKWQAEEPLLHTTWQGGVCCAVELMVALAPTQKSFEFKHGKTLLRTAQSGRVAAQKTFRPR